MEQYNHHNKLVISFFGASIAWYLSLLLSAYLAQFHVPISNPEWLYKIYWSAFYDEFQQHLFYIIFITLGVLFGLIIKLTFPMFVIKNNVIFTGTIISILLMPLAAVGIQGISLAPPWPSIYPPIQIHGGTLLSIPGILVLISTLALGTRH